MRYCLFILFILLVVNGCSQHQSLHNAIEEYHVRVARVLDVEAPEADFKADLGFASRQSYFSEMPTVSLNVREFFNIPNCPLSSLIAERNTGLGKTHLPSQRYLYEVELVSAITYCLNNAEESAIKQKLAEILTTKKTQLPVNYANLITTSEETWLALSQANGFISGDSSDGLNPTLSALRYLLNVSPVNSTSDVLSSEQLEDALQALKRSRLMARQWRSQQLIIDWFTQTNPWLSEHVDTITCQSPASEAQAKILRNVFMLFFAEQIQPIASQINHYHFQLEPLLEAFDEHHILPQQWRDSVQKNIRQHQEYREVMREHVIIWQGLFKRCGLSPARSS